MHPKTRKILQLLRLRQVKIDTFFLCFLFGFFALFFNNYNWTKKKFLLMVFHMKFIAIYVLLMITAPIEYPYFIIHSACFGAF